MFGVSVLSGVLYFFQFAWLYFLYVAVVPVFLPVFSLYFYVSERLLLCMVKNMIFLSSVFVVFLVALFFLYTNAPFFCLVYLFDYTSKSLDIFSFFVRLIIFSVFLCVAGPVFLSRLFA